MTEEQNARLDCLHMASHSAGEDSPFEYVLEGAEAYYNFVIGDVKKLSVVVPFKQTDLPDGVA